MIKVGDRFEGVVRDLASDGQGIVAHPSNRTFFVPGVWPQEQGEFCVTQLKGRIGFASLVSLKHISPDRIDPLCPHHGSGSNTCGGCPWQFMEYGAQLKAKQQRIEQAIGRLWQQAQIKQILPSDSIWAYRNRAQFKTDGKEIGYMGFRSNKLVNVSQCPVLTPPNQKTLRDLNALLPQQEWRASKKNKLTTIHIDEDCDASSASINMRRPFQQANTQQNTVMKTWLNEKLSCLDKRSSVVELFCGSGNFTEIILAQGLGNVLALEGAPEAVAALNKMEKPPLSMLTAKVCDLFSGNAFSAFKKQLREAQVLVLDPPREGLKNKQDLLPKNNKFSHVFYISCDLATLCRDLQFFIAQGFKLEELQPLDQSPHTPHIEMLVALTR